MSQEDQASQAPPVETLLPGDDTILNPPPLLPKISEFQWSYAGPIAGKTCLLWSEPADSYTWEDNYLCSDRNLGLTWKYGLPLDPAATCTQVLEPSDPQTWGDNYLCAPRNLGFVWSHNGPVAGMGCLQVREPSEPLAYTWNDNFLCLPL